MVEKTVMLNEEYPNEMLTTMSGYGFKKGLHVVCDDEDYEVKTYLKQNFLKEVAVKPKQRVVKYEKKQIITDSVPKETIKEIVTPKTWDEKTSKENDNDKPPAD